MQTRADKAERQYETHLERVKARYYRLKAAGICTMCGKVPAVEGKAHCPRCRELNRLNGKKWRDENRANGTCMRCGKAPVRKGITLCFACALKDSERMQKRYRARQSNVVEGRNI